MSEKISVKRRICLIDEIRGAAVIAMVIYHMLYSAGEVFGYESVHNIFRSVMPFEPLIPITFVFISGICTRLSRSNLRRGLILFLIAITINAVTFIVVPDIVIRFGVINLLSVCMIVYGLCEKGIKKLNCKIGLFVSLFLFAFTWGVSKHFLGIFGFKLIQLPNDLYESGFLFPLGLKNSSFYSSDYFPLFPWIFLFFAGSFFMGMIKNKKFPEAVYGSHCNPLGAAGKHSVIIYVVHQPIIFAVLTVLRYLS